MSIPQSLSFKYPVTNVITNGNSENYEYSLPSNNGSVFRSDSNSVISFNIASTTKLMKSSRSWLEFVIVPRDVNGAPLTSASTVHSTIPTSCIQRLVVKAGGATVEDTQSNYPTILSQLYATAPLSRKLYLQTMEGYGTTNGLVSGVGRKYCHSLVTSLFITEQTIPLPVISGGLTIELTIGSTSSLFTSTNVSYFTVEQPTFVWQSVIPSPDYTYKLMSALENGRSLFMPLIKVKPYTHYGLGGTGMNLQIPVGNCSSIESLLVCYRTEADIADVTKDKALIYSSSGLESVRIEVAGQSFPQSRAVTYSNGTGGRMYDPSLLMLSFTSANGSSYNADDGVSLDMTNFDGKQFRIFQAFKSEQGEMFGDGISTVGAASPNLTVITQHTAALGANVRITSLVFTSAVLEIKKDIIVLSEIF